MDRIKSLINDVHIPLTPDGKSNRSAGPVTFETPSKQNMSATNVFIDGSLEDRRKAVLQDLGPVPEVALSFMLERIVPQTKVNIPATMARLISSGALTKRAPPLTGYSWTALDGKSPSEIYDSNNPDADNENKVFRKLNTVYQAIIACARFNSRSSPTPTLEFIQDPNRAPESDSSVRTRPDGCGVLRVGRVPIGSGYENKYTTHDDGAYNLPAASPASKKSVPEKPDTLHWFDIACVEEYKIKASAKDRNDNVLKIMWSLHHIMSVDHRRRCVFGITVEDDNTRIWFACREAAFVTQAFSIAENPLQLIHLISSLAFASHTQLGYDPTMTVGWDAKEKQHYYNIEVKTKDQAGKIVDTLLFRTRGVISDTAFNLRGRATRVYDVRLMLQNGLPVLQDQGFILKDSWVDINRTKEGDTHQLLLACAPQADKDRFLSVYAHGTVQIDGQDDSTNIVMLKGQSIDAPDDEWVRSQNSRFTHSSQAIAKNNPSQKTTVGVFELSILEKPVDQSNSNPKPKTNTNSRSSKVSKPGSSQAAAKGGLKHNTNKVIQKPIVYSPKVHYRVVFTPNKYVSFEQLLDHGQATYQIMSNVMESIAKALQFMAQSGYVHRDISVANILYDVEYHHVKLIDLDFSKAYSTKASSFVRTGTYAFMAGEVMKRKYAVLEYAKKNANLQLIYNPIHDLEALWWVGVYCLVCHYPAPYDIIATAKIYRDFNDEELVRVYQLISHQQALFPSLYDYPTFERRIEELLQDNVFTTRIEQDYHPAVLALGSCLENFRKCISRAYEEIQRGLPRNDVGYFTNDLRIADPTSPPTSKWKRTGDKKTPVHDMVLEILETLGQNVGQKDEILWPLSSTMEERTAWTDMNQTRAKLRPRPKGRGFINRDSDASWED